MRSWRVFIILTVLTKRDTQFEYWMEDDRQSSGEKSLREPEFNLNIHLYLTLNYGMASEQLNFDFMVLYIGLVLSWGLTITGFGSWHLTDTRSVEIDHIGADSNP